MVRITMADGGAAPPVDEAPRPAEVESRPPVEPDTGAVSSDPPPAEPAQPSPAAARPAPALGRGSWLWKVTFIVFLLAALVAIPLLVVTGKAAVEDSTSGRVIGVVDDPTAPGYEVLVEPTPTLLLVQTEGEDLVGVTFLSASSATTGSALFLPPDLAVETPDGPATLDDAWVADGERGLVDTVEQLLGVGIAEYTDDGTLLTSGDVPVVRLDTPQWEQLVAPVDPITIENPVAIEVPGVDGAPEVRFPAGEVELTAEMVGPYLAARNPGESDLNRMERHRVFWEAWIAAVRAADPETAIAGEQDAGLGRYLRTFADGEAGLVPVEASTYTVPGADGDLYLADAEVLAAQIAAMVPFPTSPSPGARPPVEVLDGTGTPDASLLAAELLAAEAGAEVRMIGNGPNFDYAETHIIYYDPAGAEAAEAMRDALGVGRVELLPNPDEVATVTVILGDDAIESLDL
jgi:hypothetical protein